MTQLVQVDSDKGSVLFEVDEVPAGAERASRRGKNVVAELDQRLEEALASVRPAAEAVINAFRALGLDEISVEFGLRLDAEAGAVIARTGVSGHFTVSLKWTTEDGTKGAAAGSGSGRTPDTATGAPARPSIEATGDPG